MKSEPPTHDPSLEAKVRELEQDNATKFLEIRKMESDCLEHCQDWTRAQLKLNALTQAHDKLDKLTTMQDGGIRMLHDQIATLTQERDIVIEQEKLQAASVAALTQAHQQAVAELGQLNAANYMWMTTHKELEANYNAVCEQLDPLRQRSEQLEVMTADRDRRLKQLEEHDELIGQCGDQIADLKAQLQQAVEALKRLEGCNQEYLDCNNLIGSNNLIDAMIDARKALATHKEKWKCQSCGQAIAHDPIGTAAICTDCGGTSLIATHKETGEDQR